MTDLSDSLSGKVVAILRPSHQSKETAELIQNQGGIPYVVPMVEITAPLDKNEINAFIDSINEGKINTLIFLSANSVRILFMEAQTLNQLNILKENINKMKVVAIGAKTQKVLKDQGIVDVSIPEQHDTNGVIESLGEDLTQSIIGIPRSSRADRELEKALTQKGAQVHQVTAYISKAPEDTSRAKRFLDDLGVGKIDAVTFTSASTAKNLYSLTEELGRINELRKSLTNVLVTAIGPRTEGTLLGLGFKVDVIPEVHSIEAMLNALALELRGRNNLEHNRHGHGGKHPSGHPGGHPGSAGGSKKHILRIISWNSTFKCDLRCAHCYMDAQERESRQELTTEEGKMLIDQIAEVGSPVLVLSGGEPLMRKDIFELAKYGTEKGLRMAMGTNGIGISDEVAKKLLASGISKVAISVDSSTPEIHDEFRGVPGSWAKAMEGIKACLRNGLGVQFNTTVTVQNFDDIDNILKLAEGLGVKDMHLFFLVPTGRGTEVEDITPTMYEEMIRNVLTKYEDSELNVKPTCAPQFMRIADQMGIDMSKWTRGCIAGINYCRIYPEGEVTPCPYLPIKLGNIRETSFKEIWENSEILQTMRDYDNLTGRCGACEYKQKCGGCRARAYGLSSNFIEACGGLHEPEDLKGDYLGEEPWCPYQPKGWEP